MQDVWSPQLMKKIKSFTKRKDQQYPELSAPLQWYDYELMPRRRSLVGTRKFSR